MSSNKSKILMLVEGEKLEKDVFTEISKVFNLKSEIVCLRCNIFMLYNAMKEYDFNASIKDILIEKVLKGTTGEEIDILENNKFAYTYLIMDFDIQHYKNDLNKALIQIEEMCEYFLDETDDTIGKLYINYPMMESFRDREDFVDDTYFDKIVITKDIVNYKQIAGRSKLSSVHLNKYGLMGFNNLIKSNIDKARVKLLNLDSITYTEYQLYLSTSTIFNMQSKLLCDNFFYVLNTSLYLVVDYYGENYYNLYICGLQ